MYMLNETPQKYIFIQVNPEITPFNTLSSKSSKAIQIPFFMHLIKKDVFSYL